MACRWHQTGPHHLFGCGVVSMPAAFWPCGCRRCREVPGSRECTQLEHQTGLHHLFGSVFGRRAARPASRPSAVATTSGLPTSATPGACWPSARRRASQSMQQIRTALPRDGPNHLGLCPISAVACWPRRPAAAGCGPHNTDYPRHKMALITSYCGAMRAH